MTWAFLLNVSSTFFMTGLIWFVQLVHYPLFSSVGQDFRSYARRHTRQTAWVVSVPMLVELSTSIYLVWRRPEVLDVWEVWLGLGLVGLIWLSTAILQVPQHRRLAAGFDAATQRKLVMGNGFRTFAWTARSALCFYWLYRVL